MRRIMQMLVLAALTLSSWHMAHATFPLDGLTADEYTTVVAVLNEAGKTNEDSQYTLVNLAQPPKQQVLAWEESDAIDRRAFVAVRHEREMYEAVVNLSERKLESWELIAGAQPQLLDTEWMLSQVIVRSSEEWRAAVEKRGLNFKQVFCFPVFPGYFDLPRDAENTRLGMVSCYDAGHENGLWGRPISGLMAIVDYDERSIVELVDTGVVPIPDGGPAVNPAQPEDMPAMAPLEPGFEIDGSWITWKRWKFHLRIDPRVGPILSLVSVKDSGPDGEHRSMMYQGNISELFVPYQDPTVDWFFRTYLDVGEYGIGSSGVPLRLGKDCPANGELIDATFMNESGKVYDKAGVVCVFERETGDALWSHYEITQTGSQLRRRTELVVRFIVWLGNYDYLLDWVFDETGALKGRVSSTGIVLTKAVEAQSMQDSGAEADTAYGRMIAPGLVAINHDHYFGFRLDLDIDGTNNAMLVDKFNRVQLDTDETGTPREQIWQVATTQLDSENAAKLNVNPEYPAMWRVASTERVNRVDNPTSYQLVQGGAVRSLMDSGEVAQRRAAFTNYNLWVTPYDPDEQYAAGMYPNRHPGNAGLPTWTANDRSIKDTDIVLWYTVGMHHAVRAEDFPIMPVVMKEFELRPYDFFGHNPTTTEP